MCFQKAKKVFLIQCICCNISTFSVIKDANAFSKQINILTQHSNWATSPFEQKVFVENKGQFGKNTKVHDEIYFQVESSGLCIYFTKKGLVYRYNEVVEKNERNEKKIIDKGEKKVRELRHHYLELQWQGSNPAPEIVPSEKESFYYTYSHDSSCLNNEIKASTFKKITYVDLYPGIDVEYVFPDNNSGIKYSLIIHPGADPSLIKMKWKGDGCFVDSVGNTIIKSTFGEFIDHAPNSFYLNGEKLDSHFGIKGTEISFWVEQFDNKKTVIIDPWTTSPTFTANKAYDVNYDNAGNVYAYGSGNSGLPLQLAKFNSAGVLQWKYNDNHSMDSNGDMTYGDFVVDPTTGRSYLGEGIQGSGQIVKIRTSGTKISSYNTIPTMAEVWRMEYNTCSGKILCGGGGTSIGNNQAFMLDTTMVTWAPIAITSPSNRIDCALLSTDKYTTNGFMLFSGYIGSPPAIDNILVKIPLPAMTPTTISTLTGHTFREITSILYHASPSKGNGFNGMAVSPSYVYTYDGKDVNVWNKTTFALVATHNITATKFTSGGIDVDECENVYVGHDSQIDKYDASWTLIASYALSGTVYDVKLNGTNLYASGNGFVSQFNIPAIPLALTISYAAPDCSFSNGIAIANVTTCNSNPSFTYLWTPTAQTTQTATGLSASVLYSVTVSTACTTLTTSFTMPNCGVLPVELISFYLTCDKKNSVQLYWNTASELNCDYFIIERSIDGKLFESIAKVQGSGNSSSIINYSFNDVESEIKFTNFPTLYYRLKQVDFNGNYTYHTILAANCETSSANLIVYPNPSTGIFFLPLPEIFSGSLLEIWSSIGEKVYSYSPSGEVEDVIKIDLSSKPNGVYLMTLNNKFGNNKVKLFIAK